MVTPHGLLNQFLKKKKLVDQTFYFCRLFEKPTLDLFLMSQSGSGHSQWAWPFTSMQVAPKLQVKSLHDLGALGPADETSLAL